MYVYVCYCFIIEYVLFFYLINIVGMYKWIVLIMNLMSFYIIVILISKCDDIVDCIMLMCKINIDCRCMFK